MDMWESSNAGHFGTVGSGTKTISYRARGTHPYIYFDNLASGEYIEVSNISIKEILDSRAPDSVVENRKNLFEKIQNEINTFTPYETFLYYDNQSQTTASAPGLGYNFIDNPGISIYKTYDETHNTGSMINEIYSNFDGFSTVYKHNRHRYSDTSNGKVPIINSQNSPGDVQFNFQFLRGGKYAAEDNKFGNYSGSVYFSYPRKSWFNC